MRRPMPAVTLSRVWSAELRRRDAERHLVGACAAATATGPLLAALVPLLRSALDLDASVLTVTDPGTTLVGATAVVDGLPTSLCHPWFHNEYLQADVNKFADLHRVGARPATLHAATQGHPTLSPRFRELYRPLGLGPELRATLSFHGACWGLLSLIRADGKADFTREEVAWLGRVRAPLTHALRRVATASPVPAPRNLAPGIVTLTPEGEVVSMSGRAPELLAEFGGPPASRAVPADGDGAPLPCQAHAVAMAARANALHGNGAAPPITRFRGSSGRWVTVRGDHTTSPAGALVGIVLVIEPSRPADLMPVLAASYDLTAREREVLAELAAGHSTADIAARLFISEHTARDHIKAILAKTRTGSRSELLGALLHLQA